MSWCVVRIRKRTYLASFDAALIYMRDNPGNQMRMSLKLLEYLAMNLMVVGRLVGVTQDRFGKFCILGGESEKDLASIILGNLVDRPKIKLEARKYILENFSQKKAAQAMNQILAASI